MFFPPLHYPHDIAFTIKCTLRFVTHQGQTVKHTSVLGTAILGEHRLLSYLSLQLYSVAEFQDKKIANILAYVIIVVFKRKRPMS